MFLCLFLNYAQRALLLDKDGTKSREDLRVSVLEDYLSICKKYEKHCVLELKSDFTDAEISEIIGIVQRLYSLEAVTFISFRYSNLQKIRSVCPEQSVQFLFLKFDEELIARLIADRVDVDVNYKELTEEMIALLHENGLKVNCWTVDASQKAEQLVEWGVDYITTNRLE